MTALTRKLACLAVFGLATTSAATPATASAATRPSCKRAGSKTVAQNRLVRVYEVGAKLYGCRRAGGKRVLLTEAEDDEYVYSSSYGNVHLAGTFVAWSWATYDVSCKADCPPGYNPRNSGISLFDLRRRRGRSVAPTAPIGRALLVSRYGALAWLTQSGSGSPVELHVSLRLADDRVIDRGNIDSNPWRSRSPSSAGCATASNSTRGCADP